MEIRCPYCEKTVQVPGGGQFTCPSCRAVFAVDLDPTQPTPPGPTPPGPGPIPPAPPLMDGPGCAKHPAVMAAEACNRCGNFMCSMCVQRAPDGSRLCPDCIRVVLGPGAVPGGLVPWEHERQQKGVFSAYWQTMKLCFTDPARFWRTLDPDGPMGAGVGFNVFANTLFAIPMLLVMALFFFLFFGLIVASIPPAQRAQVTAMGGLAAGGLVVAAVFVPITALIRLFIGSAIYHLVAAIMGCGRGFSTTVRIIAYSEGTMIAPTAAAVVLGLFLKFVPCLGDMVSMVIQMGIFVWGLAIQYHGFKIQHNLTEGRALFCVLWWLGFMCCGFAALIFFVVSVVASAGASGGGGF